MGSYDDLRGKRVLVTGASRGIGEGIARAFSSAGARLFFHYRSDAELAGRVAAELPGEVHLFRADLSDDAQRAAMFAEIERIFGGLDGAVNNAGWNHPPRPLDAIDPELYYQLTDLNIKGTLFCCLNELRLMRGHAGSIVNIGSVQMETSVRGRTLYAASKGAIHSMTGQLSLECGKDHIRINAIAPGYIEVARMTEAPGFNREEIADGIPVGRLGEPRDIGEMAMFLVSERSTFLSGQTLVVDGGVSRKLARGAKV